ncbi:MAG: hypothetical protein Q3968_06770 [Clostridiaceae bacterium]|nr:hypothetical protein [Clostridiaceae bacterium]
MKERKVSRKVISIILSVLMVFGTMPMMAFVSTAAVTATDPVRSEGDWLQPPEPNSNNYDYWDSQFTGFDGKGGGAEYATVGLHGTLAAHDPDMHDELNRRMYCYFYFMQTSDNQVMTYQIHVIGKKNDVGSTRLTSIVTNYNNNVDFAAALNRYAALYPNPSVADEYPEYWTGGESNCTGFNPGPTFPYNSSLVDMTNTKTCHFYYTARFVADGAATYTPEWEINYSTRGNGLWGTYYDYTTSSLSDKSSTEPINYNPKFVITVVDLREVNTLIDIADNMNEDISSIINGRNFDGSVYYSQSEVDGVVAQLRALLLCDYSGLDAQIARGDAIETENYNGALGGKLYDQTKYDAFQVAFAAAKAVDRFYLDDDDNHTNQGMINAAASALQTAIDELMATRKYLVTYYVDGAVYARNTVDSSGSAYNFHDVTDHFITPPEKTGYRFIGWMDENGNLIRENTVITGDMTAYAKYYISLKGTLPYSSDGIWYHLASQDSGTTDDRGEFWVTMNVKDTDFYFVQTKEIESFSFYTDLTAYKNGGMNYARIKNVGFINDTDSNAFSALIENDGTSVSCLTGNAGPAPSDNDLDNDGVADGDLPGLDWADYFTQKSNCYVTWRYIYTFTADGAAEYNPKWNIEYRSGWTSDINVANRDLTATSNGISDTYVGFNIYVTDVREINNLLDKAESICNNNSGAVSQQDREALRGKVDSINNAYTLDGSVYYPQLEIDALVAELLAYIPSGDIPCDYTEFYEVFNRASQIDRDHGNDNNHYVDEVWDNFLACYQAAVDLDKNMMIDDANEHQQLIDTVTENLYFALEQFNYQTHVNQKANDTALINLVNSAIPTYGDDITDNANGKYDTTAYQNYLTALEQAQAVIAADYYLDPTGVNDNQAIIDSAYNALYAAIQVLNDPANQNDPCDYTALEEAISAASAITDNELFTPATYQALQDALADAQAVPSGLYDDDSGNNQQMIDDATDALVAAINNLLADAIANAQNVDTNGMTGDSIQDLNDTVSTAGTIAADSNSTPVEKSDAVIAIIDAIDALSADKSDLEIAIYSAGLIDTTDVPQALIDDLDSAVSYGQLVDGDSDASVASVEDATEQIRDAIADILQQIIDDASNADTDGMTTNSIQDLADAIDNAQAIHDDTDSNAYTLAETIADLQAALADLEPDKTELEDAITAAQNVDTTGIPQNLVDALEDAINDGNTVDGDPDATVPEIRDATDQIKDALEVILQNVITDAENTDTDGMTPESIQDLQDAIDAANDVLNEPDATAQDIADAISDIQNAVDSLEPDKTELKDAITAAESIDTTDLPQNLVDALEDAITNGNNVDHDPDATVPEIKDATDAINDAIDDILQHIIDEAKNTDTDGMTDDSKQDLQDAIDAAEDLLDPNRNPEATAQEKADAIDEIISAVTGLALNKITTKENVAVAVDRVTPVDTQYTYMVGLNPAGTVVSDIKAQLKNDESMIIITAADGNTELTANDLVGTGCLIKLVNANDHSVVYEVATVILYGDVNGDGLVDSDDKDIIGNDAFYGESNLTAGSVYYIAADLSKDGTLDAFDYFLVDGIMTGGREFDQTSELYK